MRNVKEMIYQSIGEASMCWEPTPTGEFDSDRAKQIGDRLYARFHAMQKVVEAAREFVNSDKLPHDKWCGRGADCEHCDNRAEILRKEIAALDEVKS